MYQEDMQDEGDGFKGKAPEPKVSVHTNRVASQPSTKQQPQRFSMELEQENYEENDDINIEEHEELASAAPKYDHSELYREDAPPRRKFELYDDDTITTNTQLSSQLPPVSSQHRRASYTRRASSSGLEDDEQEYAPPPDHEQQRQRRRRSRSRSVSPGGRRKRSQSRSISPGGGDGRRPSRNAAVAQYKNFQKTSTSTIGSSVGNNSDEDYHLMPLEMDANNNNNHNTSNRNVSLNKNNKNATARKEADEKYEAQIAFSLQMAFSFFCCVLILAIIMAATMVSRKGYFVVVLLFLALLLSLAVGLCYFIYHILNEEESELNNPNHQKHMPKWYKTVTKIIRDELQDFKDDWKAMCNNMLLLEDGGDGNNENNADNEDSEYDQFQDEEAMEVPSVKPKKRLGKSNLFRMVVSPAAALINFRRKRKEKKLRKKAQTRVTPFPSTV